MFKNQKKQTLTIVVQCICALLLFFACTKDISLRTEVEFELLEQHQETGFINQPLSTTFTVVPEEILENYTYSLSYQLVSGNGGYLTVDGNPLTPGEQFAMSDLSSNFMYQGIVAGSHEVIVTATDNFGFTQKVVLNYTLNNVPVNWTATGSDTQVQLGSSTAITVILSADSSSPDLTFQSSYILSSGQGALFDDTGQLIALNSFTPISPGTYVFNFNPSELGTVTLSFVLRDSNGQELIQEVTFEVLTQVEDNTPPILTLLGDNPLALIQNSAYVDPGATATDDQDGDLSDEIDIDFSTLDNTTLGTYLVTYTVIDNAMNTATTTREVNVVADTSGNQAPTAVDDNRTTEQGAVIVFDPRSNDTDPENDTLTIIGVSEVIPSNAGTTTFYDQSVTFTPATNFTGNLSFSYTINDGNNGNNATAEITISVTAGSNQAPTAVNDSATTQQNTTITFDPRTNDTDPENDALTITAATQPTQANTGTVTFDGQSITFTPAAGFTGIVSFDYTINDGTAGNDSIGTIAITVSTAPNESPIAQDDDFTIAENVILNNNVFLDQGNGPDTDPEGASFTVNQVNADAANIGTTVDGNGGGIFIILANGNITFDPNGEFDALNQGQTATSTITYTISDGTNTSNTATVTVTITGIDTANNPPVAQNDNFTIAENVILNNNVFLDQGNGLDTDPEGAPLTVNQVNGATANIGANVLGNSGGIFTILANGSITFDPNGEFDDLNQGQTATSTITYAISDGTNTSNTATVTVTITGIDTANDPPVAQNDNFTIAENVILNNNVFLDHGNGPDTDPEGAAFTLNQVNGATANIGANVMGNGGGIFTILANGNITFDPNGEFDALNQGQTATSTITYTISDGANTSNTATVTVTITGIDTANDPPVANNDNFTTPKNVVLNSANVFLDNGEGIDSDPEGLDITVDQVGGESGNVGMPISGVGDGLFTIFANGDFTFDPNGEFDNLSNGEIATASMTYRITDGSNVSNIAIVIVTITGVGSSNQPPTAQSFSFPVDENSSNNPINLSSRINDPDGDAFTVTISDPPNNGTASISGFIVTYTPNTDYTGPDSITYSVDDGNNPVVEGTISITVTPNASFDPLTGIYSAEPGTQVFVNLSSGGSGNYQAQLIAHETSTFTNPISGGATCSDNLNPDNCGPLSSTSTFTFTMPATGFAYFQGFHTAEGGTLSSGTAITITTDNSIENASMNQTTSIPN